MRAGTWLLALVGWVVLGACEKPAEEAPAAAPDAVADAQQDGGAIPDAGTLPDAGPADGGSPTADADGAEAHDAVPDADATTLPDAVSADVDGTVLPDADAEADADAGELPDVAPMDASEDAQEAGPQDAADVEPDLGGADTSDLLDGDDGAGDVDSGNAADAAPDADVEWADNPVGEAIPQITLPSIAAFQGGLYDCDQLVEIPPPGEVPGPCYILYATPDAPPESAGVKRFGYDCQMRPTYESWSGDVQSDPYLVITQAYTESGVLDEYSYDRLDIDKASYLKKHHYDGEGRLTKIVYSYPKGEKNVETAWEDYGYSEIGMLAFKDTYTINFNYEPPVESFGTNEQYTYSEEGNLVQTDVYNSEGYLLSQTKQKWANGKVVQVDEDWGINCVANYEGPVYPDCPQDGVDGKSERRVVYVYDEDGRRIRVEAYWVFEPWLVEFSRAIFEYSEEGTLLVELVYIDKYQEEQGNFFFAAIYEYDEHGRQLREGWWQPEPIGWSDLLVNNFDCWTKP